MVLRCTELLPTPPETPNKVDEDDSEDDDDVFNYDGVVAATSNEVIVPRCDQDRVVRQHWIEYTSPRREDHYTPRPRLHSDASLDLHRASLAKRSPFTPSHRLEQMNMGDPQRTRKRLSFEDVEKSGLDGSNSVNIINNNNNSSISYRNDQIQDGGIGVRCGGSPTSHLSRIQSRQQLPPPPLSLFQGYHGVAFTSGNQTCPSLCPSNSAPSLLSASAASSSGILTHATTGVVATAGATLYDNDHPNDNHNHQHHLHNQNSHHHHHQQANKASPTHPYSVFSSPSSPSFSCSFPSSCSAVTPSASTAAGTLTPSSSSTSSSTSSSSPSSSCIISLPSNPASNTRRNACPSPIPIPITTSNYSALNFSHQLSPSPVQKVMTLVGSLMEQQQQQQQQQRGGSGGGGSARLMTLSDGDDFPAFGLQPHPQQQQQQHLHHHQQQQQQQQQQETEVYPQTLVAALAVGNHGNSNVSPGRTWSQALSGLGKRRRLEPEEMATETSETPIHGSHPLPSNTSPATPIPTPNTPTTVISPTTTIPSSFITPLPSLSSTSSPPSSSSMTPSPNSTLAAAAGQQSDDEGYDLCSCSAIQQNFLKMAEEAYRSIRTVDSSPKDSERFRQELAATNQMLRDYMAIMKYVKAICEHRK